MSRGFPNWRVGFEHGPNTEFGQPIHCVSRAPTLPPDGMVGKNLSVFVKALSQHLKSCKASLAIRHCCEKPNRDIYHRRTDKSVASSHITAVVQQSLTFKALVGYRQQKPHRNL